MGLQWKALRGLSSEPVSRLQQQASCEEFFPVTYLCAHCSQVARSSQGIAQWHLIKRETKASIELQPPLPSALDTSLNARKTFP